MNKLLIPFFLFIYVATIAQPPMGRYTSDLFSVTESNNILFSQSVPQPTPGGGWWEWVTGYPLNADETNTTNVDLYMDIFEPTGDTLSMRPVVIVCFGGGFLAGSRDHWSIRLICEDLAKRGFVAAAIDYRLGMNIFDADLTNRAVYRGLQDGRAAVSFFRADAAGANNYRIDPEQIYIGGHSAGAFIATHNAYLDKESERPLSTGVWTQDGTMIPDLGTLDATVMNPSYSGHADAIFSLAGAVGFLSFMESDEDKTNVMFHSSDDDTVPFDEGEPFSGVLWIIPGSDMPTVYGSNKMASRGDSIGLPYEFYAYTDRGHSVHEDGETALYSNIVPDISDWFYTQELKPIYNEIAGEVLVCHTELNQMYEAIGQDGLYFDWSVIGGTIIGNSTGAQVEIEWDQNASVHEVAVTPYSKLDAKGDEISLAVEVSTIQVNEFVAVDNSWNSIDNWSLALLPNRCHDVIIDHEVISVLGSPLEVNSINIQGSGQLTLSGSNMFINQKNDLFTDFAVKVEGILHISSEMTVKNVDPSKSWFSSGSIDNSGTINIQE